MDGLLNLGWDTFRLMVLWGFFFVCLNVALQLQMMTNGRMEMSLEKVIRSRKLSRGDLTICSERVNRDDRVVLIHFIGKGAMTLLKPTWEYFFKMYRIRRDGYLMLVHSERLIVLPPQAEKEPDLKVRHGHKTPPKLLPCSLFALKKEP